MKLLVLPLLITLFYSCAGENQPDAERLCGCYTQMHIATRKNQFNRIQPLADSCSQIYIDILNKYENDPKGMEEFNIALGECK